MRPSRSRRAHRNRRTYRRGGASPPHPAGFPQFGVGPAPAAPAPLPNLFAAPPVMHPPFFQGFPQFGVQNPPQHPQNLQNPPQNVNMDDVDDAIEDVAEDFVGGKRRHRTRRHRTRR